MAQIWYDMGKNFNYSVNGFQGAGSFTQMLWKASTDFGLGEARIGTNIYIVGLYYPVGNVVCQVTANVMAPIPIIQANEKLNDLLSQLLDLVSDFSKKLPNSNTTSTTTTKITTTSASFFAGQLPLFRSKHIVN